MATKEQSDALATDIAIVGMALRVPGADTVERFWENLRAGVESIRSLSRDELIAAGESPERIDGENYVPRVSDLQGMELFDAEFFGFSRQEAAVMDPQHRHFLECAWEAIETSARPPKSLRGQVGVFAGCGMGSYFYFNVCSHQRLVNQAGMFLLRHTGNDKDFLATRASHCFDLRGPSVNVQTACSTSLVAVHYACQSLLNGECDMALAGGVSIEQPHRRGYIYQDGEILSPDGHCRAFDHRSAGTVFGSGTGVVVLRRLADAIADGDPIRAVIKATAINNDGASKAGYLAPSVTGQAEAVVEAQTLAGITADTVQYVECHGTGTRIGDPIEIEALTNAFRHTTDKKGFCLVGSVKSNIGHLDTAAGVVGLIKVALALEHGEIPPTLGYEKPNPAIDFAASPFQVCDRLTPWPKTPGRRRAAVNSLGVGGTNAHAIIEQPPARKPAPTRGDGDGPHLFVLSAKSQKALDQGCRNLADFLCANQDVALPDVASTLFHGRTHFTLRRAVAARDRAEAISLLRASDRKGAAAHKLVDSPSGAVFLFPGGGAQYPGMAKKLYREEAQFRKTVDEGLGYLPADVSGELRAIWLNEGETEAADRFLNPALQLPAILITEVAVARLWMSWGIKPVALIGHSMGENAAACIADVLDFRKAVELVHLRGRLFKEIPAGGMLSVPLSETELLERLPPDLDLASVNAPDLCVVSGSNKALDAFQNALGKEEIDAARVHIDIAAHSRMLEPILGRFEEFLKEVRLSAPRIPIISNLTGTWLTDAQARDTRYWRMQLSSTVLFAKGMSVLSEDLHRIYIEVGPGRTMSSLVKAQPTIKAHQVINSLPHPEEVSDDKVHFLGALGRAWAVGLNVPLERLWDEKTSRRAPLPTYPFQHETYWIAPNEAPKSEGGGTLKHETIEEWFATRTWVRLPLLAHGSISLTSSDRRWLVYSDRSAVARKIIESLPGDVRVVARGSRLKRVARDRWHMDLASADQHQALMEQLRQEGFQPTDAVYCCGLGRSSTAAFRSGAQGFEKDLNECFFAPTFAIAALGRTGDQINFSALTRGLAQLSDEPLRPMRAALLGPVLVAPREMPQIRTRCIDVEGSWLGVAGRDVERLICELAEPPIERIIALRGTSRWVQSYHKLSLPTGEPTEPWVRDGGVYIITGGLGGIGLEIAEHIARQKKVKLGLLARSELPPEEEWDDLLRVSPPESIGAQRMNRIRAIRAHGAEVAVFRCDLADGAAVEHSLAEIRAQFGAVSGVIHAAGVMDDGPIEGKTAGSMRRVLDPKIAGAIHLDQLIDEPLDFFVVFSSVASSLGLPGQVDYTAANAFLDAFAIDRSSRAKGRTTVVNWNAWRDIGMAARASSERQNGRAPTSVVGHPALDGYSGDCRTGRTFVTDFSVDKHWLLSEHKIKNGMALLSGTTFVELARAAFCVGRPPGPIEINDLTFLSPFQVGEGSTRRLLIEIAAEGGASEITMRTAGDDARILPHVVGDITSYDGTATKPVDLSKIIARCPKARSVLRGGVDDQRFVSFGPRWQNVRSARYGDREAILELALDPQFVPDLEHYQLHPALLDFATGGAQYLIPGFDTEADFYVPFIYGRLRLLSRMPAVIFSHVRLRPETAQGEAFFDITLMDAEGKIFCEITRFGMKRLDASSPILDVKTSAGTATQVNTVLQTILRDAISPGEGLSAFDRIMAQPHLVQCIASSMDLAKWERSLSADQSSSVDWTSDHGEAGTFSRPDQASEYEVPETESEKLLARIWTDLLGVRQIGVNDDFFELGGNSLNAVRLFSAIRKRYGISLPLSTLFEKPRIRQLAALLDAQSPEKLAAQPGRSARAEDPSATAPPEYSSIVPIQPLGTGPAFYCAAGMGGNPLNLRALALEIGVDQPFYGLQPQGLDGVSKPHRTVPEMAAHYIVEIKRKQPAGPYYLGGYSGGGVVAFEMAKQLTAAGEEIGALVFLDSVAPGVVLPSTLSRFGKYRSGIRQDGMRYIVEATKRGFGRMAVSAAMLARKPLRRMFPYHFRLENIADTWLEAIAVYRPEPYEGDAMLYRASSGLVLGIDIGRSNGWQRMILGTLDINECPGSHSSMCEPPHVRVLGRRLRSYLQRQIRSNASGDAAHAMEISSFEPAQGRLTDSMAS